MKIGFGTQLWLRDNHFENVFRMLDEMSLVGLDGFEMCYPFLINQYERRIDELRQLLAMHDLELATYYTGVTFYDAELRHVVGDASHVVSDEPSAADDRKSDLLHGVLRGDSPAAG